MSELTLHTFLPYLNQTFAVTYNNEDLSFVLVEAKALDGSRARRNPFSLLFVCDTPRPMPQSIYVLRHPGIGELGAFLVPIARQERGFVYQAVFN